MIVLFFIVIFLNTFFSFSEEKESKPVTFEYVRVITDKSFEEVKDLLILYLRENDLKVWKEVNNVSEGLKYTVIYSCSEKYFSEVVSKYPRLGNIFPCKILLKLDEEGNVTVSIINTEILLRVYRGIVPDDIIDTILENYMYIKSIIDQL